jgi:hypothetical protein
MKIRKDGDMKKATAAPRTQNGLAELTRNQLEWAKSATERA